MKIWLINPPIIRRRASGIRTVIRSLFYNSPPLGLAYLAAVLEQEGHEVTITDAPVENHTPESLAGLGPSMRPDLVGITATTTYFDMALETAGGLRRTLPDVPIGIGGPHFTANNDLLLAHDAFDFGVQGEGEMTLADVVERIGRGEGYADVPGVVTRNGDSLVAATPRPLIPDLDVLPLPARHLLPIRDYRPLPNDQYRLPKTAMIASRGCPFQCTFCDKQTFGNRYRGHSPKRVVEEMHHLEQRYDIRDIAFVDSVFTPSRKRVEEVLCAMEADPPKATWTCSCRANVLDEDLLGRMRTLGCWRIRIAIESGNEEILGQICKGITKADFVRIARVADRLGFEIKTFFMVGHIGETKESIEDSIRFALSLPLKDITVQINTPLRGTAQYEECRKHGTLLTNDLTRYTFFQPVFIPRGMTARTLVNAQKRFYRRFYLNPAVFWRHLRSIRSPADIGKYIRAVPLVASLLFSRR